MVAEVGDALSHTVAINACGGIFTGDDALRALDDEMAGAMTVQLLTGLIYRGPGIVRRINREMASKKSLAE